jgi:hypothetical protein
VRVPILPLVTVPRGAGALLATLMTLVVACGGTEPARPAAWSIHTAAGDHQVGVAGATLAAPITVQVRDVDGNAVEGWPVAFSVTSGGGSVTPLSAVTAQDGTASAQWRLGTVAGATQRLEVAAVDQSTGARMTVALFEATAVAGPAASISRVSADEQSAVVGTAVAVPPSVRVTDAYGNPVAGIEVTFLPDAGGSVFGGTRTTGADGLATVSSWVLGGSPGPNTLTASAAGIPPVSFRATATAAPVTPIATIKPSETSLVIAPGYEVQLSATAFDASGAFLPGRKFEWHSDNPSVVSVTIGGVVKAERFGSATLTVSSEGKSATVAVSVPAFSRLTVVRMPTEGRAGVSLDPPPMVQLADAAGNPVAVRYVALEAWVEPDGTGGKYVTVTDPQGVAWFDVKPITRVGDRTIRFFAKGREGVDTLVVPVRVTTGPALYLRNAPGAPTTVAGATGTVLPNFVVQALDAGGNPVAGQSVTFYLNSGDEGKVLIDGATQITDANGIASTTKITAGATAYANPFVIEAEFTGRECRPCAGYYRVYLTVTLYPANP